MNSVVLGNPFFKKYNIEIRPGENLLKLPDVIYQLNEIKITNQGTKKFPKTKFPVCLHKKTCNQTSVTR